MKNIIVVLTLLWCSTTSGNTILLAEEHRDLNYSRVPVIEPQSGETADQIAEIADTGSGDVSRDRLRVDTRKWYLSKVLPKLYGDKVEVEHSGIPEITVRILE